MAVAKNAFGAKGLRGLLIGQLLALDDVLVSLTTNYDLTGEAKVFYNALSWFSTPASKQCLTGLDAGVCAVTPYCRPAQKEQRVTAHIVGKRRFLQAPPMSLIGRPPLVETRSRAVWLASERLTGSPGLGTPPLADVRT